MTESRWKREARGLFFLLVIASAISLLLSAYFEITYHKAGADAPTAEKTVADTQHGKTKYISASEAERIRLFWTISLVGFPSSFLFGLILQFVFKVDILKQEKLPAWTENLINNVRKKQL